MPADGKSTLASVSKWNSGKVNWRPNLSFNHLKNKESLFILFWLSLGPLLNLDLYHLNCFCHPQSDQSAQAIIYGNQNYNYLNAIKAVQLMVGKQLLVSTSLINPFGTLIIDQHNRESINLSAFITSFLEQSDGISIVFFSTKFQRTRGCNYEIPRLSQNKMKRL